MYGKFLLRTDGLQLEVESRKSISSYQILDSSPNVKLNTRIDVPFSPKLDKTFILNFTASYKPFVLQNCDKIALLRQAIQNEHMGTKLI